MNDGHWYPSATEMGDGDIISFGGLRGDSSGSVTTELYSAAAQSWQPTWKVHQSWNFWGLYPSMVLMQDGRLFYTGSHVFGNGTPARAPRSTTTTPTPSPTSPGCRARTPATSR